MSASDVVAVPVQSRSKVSSTDWPTSIQSLLATVVIAVFVITFVIQAFQIPSESMENTLLIGDYLLVDKFCYGGGGIWDRIIPYRKIHRGDIVVFHYPVRPSQHFVKRVVGVPGDRVRLVNKQVWVNGTPLKEPYVRYSAPTRDTFRDDFPENLQALQEERSLGVVTRGHVLHLAERNGEARPDAHPMGAKVGQRHG